LQRAWTVVTRDQVVTFASLIGIALLAWLYLLHMAMRMPEMDMGAAMTPHPEGSLTRFSLTALMWAVMMIGMMLPSAMPMILLFAAVQRRHAARPARAVTIFVAGYLLVWGGFSLLAAALQQLLAGAMLLSGTMALVEPWTGGLLFLVAGLYELSPLKGRCLDRCRGPLAFITGHWRPGLTGAFRMGVAHGAYCLGCCWALMLLLFAGGVMNLIWVAALAALVLVQKVAPDGVRLARAGGIALSAVGVALLFRAI